MILLPVVSRYPDSVRMRQIKPWDGVGLMNNVVSGYYELALSELDGPIIARVLK